MNPQPRRFRWYLGLIVLVILMLKSPIVAGHLALLGVHLLAAAVGALATLAGAL